MPLDIAIVGAGVAGLSAACFLKDTGHRVVVLERFERARPVGSGLLLQPTGLAVLGRLGARERAMALGARIERLAGRVGPAGRVIFDLRYDQLAPGLHGLALHRASLFHVLWSEAMARRLAIEPAAEIVDAEPGAGRRLTLVDGRGRRRGPFDLVVDASGARSKLRARLGAVAARPYRYGAAWGTAPANGLSSDALQQRYKGAKLMAGVLPVGRLPDDPTPRVALFWSLPVAEHAAWAARGVTAWREDIGALWPEAAALAGHFADPTELSLASYAQLSVRRCWRDRLVTIGDAAHQTSPQLGQGANMALLDAAALADALADYADLGEALPAYEARRRAHLRFYQAASACLTPFFQSDSRAAGALRDAAFGPLAGIPYLRREMIRTLAGLKTGLLGWDTAERLAGADERAVSRRPAAP